MADLFLLLSAAEVAVMCCGLAATLRRRPRLGLWLYLAGAVTGAAGAVAGRAWPLAAADAVLAAAVAWALWRYRPRRERAPRAYGAKSRARVAALARKAREAARPRPVRRLAPQG